MKITLEYRWSDAFGRAVISLDYCLFHDFKKLLAAHGIEIEWKEVCDPWHGNERINDILRSVHEVQGLKMEEGIDVTCAIESLVAKYAEIK